MSVEQEILVTGIKVVDLLAPYAKGGKIGLLIFFLIFFFYKIHMYFFTQEFLVNLLLCMRHSLKVCLVVLVLARLC